MKNRLSFFIKLILFIFVVSFLYSNVSKILVLKDYDISNNINSSIRFDVLSEKADGFYALDRNSLDVLFIGSSNIHCNINPNILWHEYGVTSYDFSSDQQDLGTSYYYLKEALKSQKPSIAVIDIRDGGKQDSISDMAAHFAFDHLKNDCLRIEAILGRARGNAYEMIFPIIAYHDRWKSISKNDLLYKKYQYNVLKGALIYMDDDGASNYCPVTGVPDIELSDASCEWIEKIEKLCKDNNISCIFIKTPFGYYDENYFAYFKAFGRYCEEKGYVFLDMHDYVDEMRIDFQADYRDSEHMNWNGQQKLTHFLGGYLFANYSLYDKRNDVKYKRWDYDYDIMISLVNDYYSK